MARAARYDERDVRIRPGRGSRPRTKQRPEHADAEVALVTAVDRGRYAILVDPDGPDERVAIAMKARELGRDRVVPGDRVDIVGDTSGDEGSLSRIVRIGERTDRAAPHRRRHRPDRADHRRQRRPAGDRDRAGRPRAAHAHDRPLRRRRLRRPDGRPARADQGRPGRPGEARRHVRADRGAGRGQQPRRRSACIDGLDDAARRARRADVGARRPLRGGQVDAGQRAGARHGPRGRRGQRRDRPRPAHLELRGRAAGARDARAHLGHRHPGRAVVRARARGPAAPAGRVRGPGRGGAGVPARLHARRRRPRLRARRVGAGLPRRHDAATPAARASSRSAGCWPAGWAPANPSSGRPRAPDVRRRPSRYRVRP